ncbi:MAG: phospholipase C [Actinomycetota bacterium]
MSVTTSGPFTPVVRRITPSGEVNFGESFAGVTQPLTQALVVSPLRGGGDAGGEGGGTGDVVTTADAESLGRMTGVEALVGCSTLPPPLPQADVNAAAARMAAAIGNRRGREEGLRRTGCGEDIAARLLGSVAVGRPDHQHDSQIERVTRRRFLRNSALALAGATLYACTGGGRKPTSTLTATASVVGEETRWPIKRVVYVMLENRSYDNLFGRFPGSRGSRTGVLYGKEVPLRDCPQWLPGDLPHDRSAFLNDVNGGKYDGFGNGQFGDPWAYTQFAEHSIPNYYSWAREYVLCDNFYASAAGPSYPNHFFFVAGQSGGVIDNPENIGVHKTKNGLFKSWGCDAVGDDVFVLVKDDKGNLTKHDTCFDFQTVPQQLESAGVSWTYYAADPGQSGYFWNALNGIGPVFHTDLWREGDTIRSVDRLVKDIEADRLPAVTWVTPRFELSDHPPENTCFAHDWLTGVVNALMKSPSWEHTALFVTWDEWGGFYDHVQPPAVDDIGLGFRVPMLVLSPYAKKGYIDDAEGEFSTPLKFIEDNWGLDYLTPRIERTHNFEHVFDFAKAPRKPKILPVIGSCYGTPWKYPGDTYPGWPPGTNPDPSFFV